MLFKYKTKVKKFKKSKSLSVANCNFVKIPSKLPKYPDRDSHFDSSQPVHTPISTRSRDLFSSHARFNTKSGKCFTSVQVSGRIPNFNKIVCQPVGFSKKSTSKFRTSSSQKSIPKISPHLVPHLVKFRTW